MLGGDRLGTLAQLVIGGEDPRERADERRRHRHMRPRHVVDSVERGQRRLEEAIGGTFVVVDLQEWSDAQNQCLQ